MVTRAPPARITWDALVGAEPRLRDLADEIRALQREQRRVRDPRFCGNSAWYGWRKVQRGFKPRLVRLVGWDRRRGPDWLQTPTAYSVAYQHLYDMVPACRDCSCMRSP